MLVCTYVELLKIKILNCCSFSPSAATKVTLASSVVEQFPCLKDCQGKGYVSTVFKTSILFFLIYFSVCMGI